MKKPFNQAALEVLDFIDSGTLFTSAFDGRLISGRPCRVVESIAMFDRFREPNEHLAEIGDKCWSDILHSSEADLGVIDRSDPQNVEWWNAADNAMQVREHQLIRSCQDFLPADECGFVCNALQEVFRQRVFRGVLPGTLAELMYDALRAGAYPVGWAGEYPEGMLAVYCPRGVVAQNS